MLLAKPIEMNYICIIRKTNGYVTTVGREAKTQEFR